MLLEWVNHAGFVIEASGVRLLCDPWIEGDAFDAGWRLLSPTRFTYADFASITHLWFSHEHPDHFSPPNLSRIPKEIRRQITVLYQETTDRKVVSFCERLGFGEVRELRPGCWHRLAPDFEVRCEPHHFGDSWMVARAAGVTLVNLNDCVINARYEAEAILAQVPGPIDVLLTQFSYANWTGNREDRAARLHNAAGKLDRVALQAEVLRPKVIVPFASFVYFCHAENAWHNDGANTVADAVAAISSRTDAAPVVLYPGDRWPVGHAWDNAPALERYAVDRARALGEAPLNTAEPVPLPALIERSQQFVARLAEKSGPRLLAALRGSGALKPAQIFLDDLGVAVTLTTEGLVSRDLARSECDVALGSAALDYALRFDWGGDTLLVNGRFEQPPGGHPERFRRYFSLASMNNRGETLRDYLPVLGTRVRKAASRWLRARLDARVQGATETRR